MFGIGLVEIVVIVVLLPLALFPWWRILRRMGWSPVGTVLWIVAFAIPGVSLLASWYLALTSWPAVDEVGSRVTE